MKGLADFRSSKRIYNFVKFFVIMVRVKCQKVEGSFALKRKMVKTNFAPDLLFPWKCVVLVIY